MLVTDLSVSRAGMAFINDHGCERYFAHNQNLQFYERAAPAGYFGGPAGGVPVDPSMMGPGHLDG